MATEPSNWSETVSKTGLANRAVRWSVTNIQAAWRVLEYSSAYLAMLAALEVFMVQLLLSLPMSPAPIVVGLATFSIYANDRLVDLDTDAVSNPQRTAFVRRYRTVLYVLAAVAYGSAVALSVLGGPVALAISLVPGVAWVLYAIGQVPAIETPFQRLKEVLVLSSATIAVAWSLTIVFLPIVFAGVAVTPSAWVIFGYLALGTFVCSEISNARDVESDIESGASTLPVAIGVRRTRYVLYGITLLIAAMIGIATSSGHLTIVSAGALFTGLLGLIGIIALVGRIENGQLLSVAGEFSRVPVLATFVLASYVV